MGGDLCRPINVDSTRKGKCLKITLIVMVVIYLALMVVQICYKEYPRLFMIIFGLTMLILLCVFHNPFYASFLIFFLFFSLVYIAVFLALRLQNHLQGIPDDEYLNDKKVIVWIELCDLFFHMALIGIAFHAYREFSAIMKGDLREESNEERTNLLNNSSNNNNNSISRGTVPFTGHSVMVGGN